MTTWRKLMWMIVWLPMLAACSKKLEPTSMEATSAPVAGETPKAGALLAYEHSISINMPVAQISGRVSAVREACDSARFGACNVLRIEQSDRDASLTVRVVPAGVEPLSGLASQGGAISSRETSAQDLSEAVADNRRQREQLDAYATRLGELAQRKDLAVADLIAVSREQAQVQTQQATLEKEATQQQRLHRY
ncbi:DUF4349 domain-containing protein [Paraburkholderia adhaesiva]|uniref:DUF4349 domain-containing protein n=1 Tax=Paraburkholderia adhaesiva TaxID=2883244 RepID=UPI001F245EBA|nr:DUF4349 domain-containing protein [Paraburkholderia adhaesiva]